MKANERWPIRRVARTVGVETHVLRHWEDVGLLAPERDGNGNRRYRREDLVRVVVIQRNKMAGMGLEQIRVLLDSEAADRHSLLQAHLADLDARARELERSRAITEHALRCRAHDIANCPRFAAHVADVLAELEEPGPLTPAAP